MVVSHQNKFCGHKVQFSKQSVGENYQKYTIVLANITVTFDKFYLKH